MYQVLNTVHPTLSLCICTRNRPDDLSRCLEAIAAGETLPHQVIVSDDSDPNRTAESLAQKYPFVHYQHGPHIGLGANRNACIASATGTHLAFIDDDVLIPPDFVSRALALAASQPHSTILTGIEFNHSPAGTNRVQPGNPDFWGYQRVPPNGTYRAVVINSAVFPASLFESALFDDKLRYGCDEIDISRHALSLGYKIAFDSSLHVDHYPSQIHRSENMAMSDASRLYSTTKCYLYYERKPLKALAYALLAPTRLAVNSTVRRGPNGFSSALRSITTAWQYLRRESNTRKQESLTVS